jgi:hypothetical protein
MSTLNEENKIVLVTEANKLADFISLTISQTPKGVSLSCWTNKKFFKEETVCSTTQIKFAENWIHHLIGKNNITEEAWIILQKIFFKLDVSDLCYLVVRTSSASEVNDSYLTSLKEFIMDYYNLDGEESFKVFIDKVKNNLLYDFISNSTLIKDKNSPIRLNGLRIADTKVKFNDKIIDFSDFISDDLLFSNRENVSIPVYFKEDKDLSIFDFANSKDIEQYRIGSVKSISLSISRNNFFNGTKCFASVAEDDKEKRTVRKYVADSIKDFRFTSPGRYIDKTKLDPSLYNGLRETPVELIPIFENKPGLPVITKFILNILF